jgi:predicted amidohydrolase YtcJ
VSLSRRDDYVRICGDEERGGTPARGCRGDAAVLSEDIFEIAPREILDMQVDCTIVGGEVLYRRAS